jgi:hypothetical protein
MEGDRWPKIVRLIQMRQEVFDVYDNNLLEFKYNSAPWQQWCKAVENLKHMLQQFENEIIELLASYTEEDKK